ncbi:MAG: methylaspartate mutase accessory protein GlmL [Defluviitaleaceae bacterium]|nr:methylaspartate mutase accessory protein GlmL [Defluviitaleaceae bacterium]
MINSMQGAACETNAPKARNVLLCDIGSTYTKLTAVDIEKGKIIGFSKSYTTIEDDVTIGYNKALELLKDQTGEIHFAKKLCASSAAGGLKIISSGLVPDLTAKASRLASASAGGKVIKTYSYELTEDDAKNIESENPDIILLSGGIDGGNKEVLLHNATMVSKISGNFHVIVAGNKSAKDDVAKILSQNVVFTENVMPEFGVLNIEPVKEVIRKLFIENIVSAKGLDSIQKIMDMEIIPTPLAVLEACEILGKNIGEIMAYDLGGATTDVYSIADGSPKTIDCFMNGLQEPYAKRTVEGDLGMRYSMEALLEQTETENLIRGYQLNEPDYHKWIRICREYKGTLPTGDFEKYHTIDEAIASEAIKISTNRHVGTKKKVMTLAGEAFLQEGKDLTGIKYIIGSGGAIINARNPQKILQKAIYTPSDAELLKPLKPTLLLDESNCMCAMGLLSRIEPNLAVQLMKENFKEI